MEGAFYKPITSAYTRLSLNRWSTAALLCKDCVCVSYLHIEMFLNLDAHTASPTHKTGHLTGLTL